MPHCPIVVARLHRPGGWTRRTEIQLRCPCCSTCNASSRRSAASHFRKACTREAIKRSAAESPPVASNGSASAGWFGFQQLIRYQGIDEFPRGRTRAVAPHDSRHQVRAWRSRRSNWNRCHVQYSASSSAGNHAGPGRWFEVFFVSYQRNQPSNINHCANKTTPVLSRSPYVWSQVELAGGGTHPLPPRISRKRHMPFRPQSRFGCPIFTTGVRTPPSTSAS